MNKKEQSMKSKLLTGTAIGVAAILTSAAGCATDKSEAKSFFPAAGPDRKVFQVADAQARAGAREDGMLVAMHFDGNKLNSLGQEKLALMLPEDPQGDVSVWLNLPESADSTGARKTAVLAYLHEQGFDDKHALVAIGSNPNVLSPSAVGVARLPKLETGKPEVDELKMEYKVKSAYDVKIEGADDPKR